MTWIKINHLDVLNALLFTEFAIRSLLFLRCHLNGALTDVSPWLDHLCFASLWLLLCEKLDALDALAIRRDDAECFLLFRKRLLLLVRYGRLIAPVGRLEVEC